MKKYELTAEKKVVFGKTLYRVRALVTFGNVVVGELGGWIEKESNLDQSGDAWVSGNAQVYGDARVYGNAQVSGDARVYGNAQVYGDAWVYGNAQVYGDALVYGNAQVYGNAWVEKSTHMLTIGAIGSRNGFTTFFRCKDKKIRVVCGCFYGTLAEFAEKVNETHGDRKHARTYAITVELAKAQIEDVDE